MALVAPCFFGNIDEHMQANRTDSDLIQKDRWGNPFVYRLDAAGSSAVYSWGENGLDEHGKGDDILMPSLSN